MCVLMQSRPSQQRRTYYELHLLIHSAYSNKSRVMRFARSYELHQQSYTSLLIIFLTFYLICIKYIR